MNDEPTVKDVINALENAGVDISTAAGRTELAETIRFAKLQQKRCEKFGGYIVLILIGGAVTFVATQLWDLFSIGLSTKLGIPK